MELWNFHFKIVLIVSFCVIAIDSVRILCVFPLPSLSHQFVFRSLTRELAKRGHELVIITPIPAFDGSFGNNLTEIDVHNVTYHFWHGIVNQGINGESSTYDIVSNVYEVLSELVENQLKSEGVQNLIRKQAKFDVVLVESCVRSALIYSYIFKAPVIQVSSVGNVYPNLYSLGAPTHLTLYPEMFVQKIHGMNVWDKIHTLYHEVKFRYLVKRLERKENEMIKRNFGAKAPTVGELYKRVEMLFLNTYPPWDNNRPVPPNVVYIGGIYKGNREQNISQELKEYLDSSTQGVIYMSLGTNIQPSLLPRKVIKIFMNVFARLSYNVLLKWDADEIQGRPKNVVISKWMPQSELLKHPNIKVFITQAGWQSTEDAISAGVPLIAFPLFADQWYHAGKYVNFNIGRQLDITTISEKLLEKTILSVIQNQSFRAGVTRLRSILRDQPHRADERAAWWVAHVARHAGARHLRTPMADATWQEYLLLDLLCALLVALLLTTYLMKVILEAVYEQVKSISITTMKKNV